MVEKLSTLAYSNVEYFSMSSQHGLDANMLLKQSILDIFAEKNSSLMFMWLSIRQVIVLDLVNLYPCYPYGYEHGYPHSYHQTYPQLHGKLWKIEGQL